MNDCAVVGAGIHGLCAAFWLRQAGARVVVLERLGPEHAHGSSHGALRITRSSYHEPAFVRLAAAAHRDGWPALERALGRPLRVPTPGVFFGPPDGPFGDYVTATLSATDAVEQLPTAVAAARFPLLRFSADDAVLLDHSAAMLLAAAAMQGLRAWLLAKGVEFRWNTTVAQLEAQADGIRLETSGGIVASRTAIVAAGAANAQLVPGHGGPLTVLRQQVGYFDVDAEPGALAAGAFPVWARIGRQPNDFQYGLPSHEGAGLKAAQHRTAGAGDDPATPPPPIDREALLVLARERFTAPVRRLLAAEPCLYTMTRDHGFTVGATGHDPRIVGIAACSGHAFKFGPVVGRRAAETALATLPGPRR